MQSMTMLQLLRKESNRRRLQNGAENICGNDNAAKQWWVGASWLVQNTQPSQPITWLILTKQNTTKTKNNTKP